MINIKAPPRQAAIDEAAVDAPASTISAAFSSAPKPFIRSWTRVFGATQGSSRSRNTFSCSNAVDLRPTSTQSKSSPSSDASRTMVGPSSTKSPCQLVTHSFLGASWRFRTRNLTSWPSSASRTPKYVPTAPAPTTPTRSGRMAAVDDDARRRAACHNVMQAAGRAELQRLVAVSRCSDSVQPCADAVYLPNELRALASTQGCSYAASKTLRKDKVNPRS